MPPGLRVDTCDDAGVDTLTFRSATEADVADLVALVHAAYRDPEATGWTTEAQLLGGQRIDTAMLADALAHPDVTVVVAESAGVIVGCATLRHTDGAAVAGFGLFAVAPAHQSSGVGGALLTRVEQLAASRGATRLRLEVIHLRSELLGWYHRRGYAPTGETLPFPYGDERFGLPRRGDLHFVVLEGELGPG